MNDSFILATRIIADSILGLCSLGIFGNVAAFYIFSRKKFKKTFFRTYFRSICIVDTITFAYPINAFFLFQYGLDTYNLNIFFCIYFEFIIYVCPSISAWILTMISFDRMVRIAFPTYFNDLKKKLKLQYLYCIFVTLCSMVAYSPIFYYREFNTYTDFDNQTNQTNSYNLCELKPGAGSILWTDLGYANIVPALLMLIFNIKSISSLFRSRRVAAIGISKRDIRFAFTSFTLILAFFIFLIFSQLIYLFFAYGIFENDEEIMFWNTLACFVYTINYSLIFYLNMAANSTFRKEFISIIDQNKSLFLSIYKQSY